MPDVTAAVAPSAKAFLSPYIDADVFENVHVAKPGKATKPAPGTEKAIRVLRPPPIFLVGLVMLLAVALGHTVGRGVGIPSYFFIAGFAVLLGVPLILLKVRTRVPKAKKNAPIEPAVKSDEAYRLRLMATRDQANALGPLRPDAFEPLISPVYFALRGPRGVAVCVWIVASIFLMAAWYYAKKEVGLFGGGIPQFYEVWACFGIAAAPFAFLWPTYVRVSPGRLDVFQYGVLGSGTPRVRTFDLRTHKVYLNIMGKTLELTPEAGPPVVVDLGLWSPKPLELARAIFEAARWKHERPSIPDDELVG